MTIQEMRDKKKEMGYTYAQIADLSEQSRRFFRVRRRARAMILFLHWSSYSGIFLW